MSRYKKFDVVIVPFPYADSPNTKKRPALIISNAELLDSKIGHSICAMITSSKNASWPLDVEISDLKEAGLPAPSIVRMKLFTLDHKLIIKKIGMLSEIDKKQVTDSIKASLKI